MTGVRPPQQGDEWVALSQEALAVSQAESWAVRADCGAVVSFRGTARDHSGNRAGVTGLDYEAFEDQSTARMGLIASAVRGHWPEVGRLVLWHRVGRVELGESAVLVVVSAPHRDEAFEACRFGIDAIKATVPIWKRETWADGQDWGLTAQPLVDLADFESARMAGATVGGGPR
jgi:molybdopterin synthase catalytic subunit